MRNKSNDIEFITFVFLIELNFFRLKIGEDESKKKIQIFSRIFNFSYNL